MGRPLGAVVLVHGGGGCAFPDWVTMWVQRGYVAVAVDVSGAGVDAKPHAFAGPAADDDGKFFSIADRVENTWMFHSVSAVLRCVSMVLGEPDVDPELLFIYGISWGSHVAQLAASVDTRIRRATFVYGAGYLDRRSSVAAPLDGMEMELAKQWVDEFDSSRHLHRIEIPTLWITGTQDRYYALDTFQGSAALPAGPTVLRMTPGFEHSHEIGWSPIEPYEFFREATGGVPLPRLAGIAADGNDLSAHLSCEQPVAAHVHFTTDSGPWADRVWTTQPAGFGSYSIYAPLPARDATVILSATDVRGAVTTTRYVTFADARAVDQSCGHTAA